MARSKWSTWKVGDLLHMVQDYGDQLYEVTEMGGKGKRFHLKAKCFFGQDIGKKITLWKLNKEDE